jgi:hypothetical protein
MLKKNISATPSSTLPKKNKKICLYDKINIYIYASIWRQPLMKDTFKIIQDNYLSYHCSDLIQISNQTKPNFPDIKLWQPHKILSCLSLQPTVVNYPNLKHKLMWTNQFFQMLQLRWPIMEDNLKISEKFKLRCRWTN